MLTREYLKPSLITAALLLGLGLLGPAWAQPAQLKVITLTHKAFYLEVTLSFDTRPQYDESMRFDPDRYLLTFTGCKSAVPEAKLKQLGAIEGRALSRISVFSGADNIAVGFYMSRAARPLIRADERGYTLRFYLNTRGEESWQLADKVSLAQKSVSLAGRLAKLYVVRIDPGAPVTLSAVAADRYDGKTRLRAPGSFARREDALAVINGGFFGRRGEHLSTLVEQGVMRASGVYPTRPMLVVTKSGQWLIGRYNVVTALRFSGKALPVNAKNYPFESGKVMVYDDTFPLDTLPQEAMFYYLVRDGKLSYYSTATKGLSLAPGELLLATDIMPEVNPLKQVPDGAEVELDTRITDAEGQALAAESVIGGAPMLVENGAVELSVAEDKVKADIAKSERSRTAVGMTPGGTLILVVVKEDEDAEIGGMTLKALAELMIAEGAVTAMNLDGGGSSAIVVGGQVLNEAESEQRPVSNVLVVTEQ